MNDTQTNIMAVIYTDSICFLKCYIIGTGTFKVLSCNKHERVKSPMHKLILLTAGTVALRIYRREFTELTHGACHGYIWQEPHIVYNIINHKLRADNTW